MMKKLLLVDDEESTHIIIREELEDEGYVVVSAYSVFEALSKVDSFNPDLVIIDIQMSINGKVLVNEIRKGAHKELPLIICSAYGYGSNDTLYYGADDYVVKSPCLEELILSIEKLVC